MSLTKEVEKYLKKQAKLNEESEKIIDLFLKEHGKNEIYCVMDYIITAGAPRHSGIIKEFIQKYEEDNLKVEDIKSYLNMWTLHKDKMKAPKKVDEENVFASDALEAKCVEEKHE